jgi:hypothetical protein
MTTRSLLKKRHWNPIQQEHHLAQHQVSLAFSPFFVCYKKYYCQFEALPLRAAAAGGSVSRLQWHRLTTPTTVTPVTD